MSGMHKVPTIWLALPFVEETPLRVLGE